MATPSATYLPILKRVTPQSHDGTAGQRTMNPDPVEIDTSVAGEEDPGAALDLGIVSGAAIDSDPAVDRAVPRSAARPPEPDKRR